MTVACWRAARGLPVCEGADVVLDVPDVRQKQWHGCGAAALACALRFHGLLPGPWVGKLTNPVQGMAPDTVEAVLRAVFGRVVRGEMTLADLRHFTRTGRPVLCPVAIGDGHWVVVRGVERGRVHYQDPDAGPAVVTAAAWTGLWHDRTPEQVYRRFGLVGWPEEGAVA